MDVNDFPLDEDEFEIPEEPRPTTTVIPFAKDDIAGRTIHMVYEIDGSYSFFKGKVISYLPKKDEFSVKFWDGDKASIDFASESDTILWETRDITRGGRWKEKEADVAVNPIPVEPAPVAEKPSTSEPAAVASKSNPSASDVVAKSSPAAPVVGTEPSTSQPAVPMKTSPVAPAPPHTVSVPVADKKPTIEKQKYEGPVFKRKAGGSDLRKEEPKKKVLKSPKSVPKQVAHSGQGVIGQKPGQEATKDVGAKHGDENLKDTINVVGRKFLSLLGDIKQSTEDMNALAGRLESFGNASTLKSEDDISIVKYLKGFLNKALKKPHLEGEKDLSLGRAWPLNDIVLQALGNLHEVALKLCAKANMQYKIESRDLHRWKNERKDSRQADEIAAMSTPAKVKQFSPPAVQRSEMKHHKVAKVEWETFTSTGNSTRDDAIKIFAHALMSAETPFELAVDIEHALYAKYKAYEDTSGDALSDEYYQSIKGIWEILHPDSATCHSIVRMMMLGGYLKGKDLVSLSAEDCSTKEKAFLDTLRQKV